MVFNRMSSSHGIPTRTDITHSASAEKYFQLLNISKGSGTAGSPNFSRREGYSDIGLGRPLGYTRVNAITFDNRSSRRRCRKRFGLCIIG